MSENRPKKEEEKIEDEGSEVSLVPLYSPLDVSRGLKAYRRGDVILYTVRGEPSKIQELINELDGRGVSEVIALVSHRTGDKTIDEIPAEAVAQPVENESDDEDSG